MLEGWYCRTLANEQSNANVNQQNDANVDVNGDDSDSEESFVQNGPGETTNNGIDYKSQYRYLKRKLKFLIYENEFFQDALRINQRRLLKVSRDRSFLLDRLLQYEKPENTSSESEDTESSEDEATKEAKKRKFDQNPNSNNATAKGRKKKIGNGPQPQTKLSSNHASIEKPSSNEPLDVEDERVDMARVEMQQLQPILPPIPNRSAEVAPSQMFNDRSLESDSNDHIMDDSSPSHVAAEECVPMEYSNN